MSPAAPPPGEHLPDRATWDCRVCADAWPCEPAKTRLLATMGSANLGVYAAAQLFDAVAHLPDVSPAELWTRFLGWIRAADRPAPGPGWPGNSAGSSYRSAPGVGTAADGPSHRPARFPRHPGRQL